jgi:hypothetical protein
MKASEIEISYFEEFGNTSEYETEIIPIDYLIDINRNYLKEKRVKSIIIPEGFTWHIKSNMGFFQGSSYLIEIFGNIKFLGNCSYMFSGCTGFRRIYGKVNFSGNCSYMFLGCISLVSITPTFNRCKNVRGMFYGCFQLESDTRNWGRENFSLLEKRKYKDMFKMAWNISQKKSRRKNLPFGFSDNFTRFSKIRKIQNRLMGI